MAVSTKAWIGEQDEMHISGCLNESTNSSLGTCFAIRRRMGTPAARRLAFFFFLLKAHVVTLAAMNPLTQSNLGWELNSLFRPDGRWRTSLTTWARRQLLLVELSRRVARSCATETWDDASVLHTSFLVAFLCHVLRVPGSPAMG